MYCTKCGNEITSDSVFCNRCGKQVFEKQQKKFKKLIKNIEKRQDLMDIIDNIYNISQLITEKLKKLMIKQDTYIEQQIKNSPAIFISITNMFCYAYFSKLLEDNYKLKPEEIFVVLYALTTELSSHLRGVTQEKTWHIYLQISKDVLESINDRNDTTDIASEYLILSTEYEKEEVDIQFLQDIKNEFYNILDDIYNIKKQVNNKNIKKSETEERSEFNW